MKCLLVAASHPHVKLLFFALMCVVGVQGKLQQNMVHVINSQIETDALITRYQSASFNHEIFMKSVHREILKNSNNKKLLNVFSLRDTCLKAKRLLLRSSL